VIKLKMKRDADEAIRSANAHKLRTDILCYLNEGAYTTQQLSTFIKIAPSTISHHLSRLLDDGCIEVADSRPVRNFMQRRYRAVKMPFFTDEEMAELPIRARTEIYGLIVQAAQAEALAALRAGKISNDPRAVMAWKWFNVDRQGREDIADELTRSWDRLIEIEGESATRRSNTGEEASTIIVSSFGFERAKAINEPAPHVQGKLVDQ
jgi:DNA-binding transcriptional ArsR family regulator